MNIRMIFAFLPLILTPFVQPSSPLVDVTVAYANGDIYIANFTGEPTDLTNTPRDDDILPVWSADGTQLAFLSQTPERKLGDYRLVVMDVATRTTQQVSSLPLTSETNLAWSPDSRSIGVTLGALFVVDVAAGDTRQLSVDRISAQSPSWSPDSSHIAFQARGGIYAIDANRGSIQNIGNHENVQNYYPQWSPVSDEVAFVFFHDDVPLTLAVAYPETLTLTPLVEMHGDTILYLWWSPDGQQIAFNMHSSKNARFQTVDNTDVFVMNADGSSLRPVTREGRDQIIGWASNSEIIYYRGDLGSTSGSFYAVDPAYGIAVRLSDDGFDRRCSYGNCENMTLRP